MLQLQIITYTDNKVKLCIVMDLLAKTIITPSKIIDLMQLRAYLIRNQAPHVINSHVHLAVAILSGEKIEVVR